MYFTLYVFDVNGYLVSKLHREWIFTNFSCIEKLICFENICLVSMTIIIYLSHVNNRKFFVFDYKISQQHKTWKRREKRRALTDLPLCPQIFIHILFYLAMNFKIVLLVYILEMSNWRCRESKQCTQGLSTRKDQI